MGLYPSLLLFCHFAVLKTTDSLWTENGRHLGRARNRRLLRPTISDSHGDVALLRAAAFNTNIPFIFIRLRTIVDYIHTSYYLYGTLILTTD
jgi:hypothetical protein